MKLNRLQHNADNLCQIFCGWQLMSDWKTLTNLKSGTIQMDLLKDCCLHNGKEIPKLMMNCILGSWLREDLGKNKIPIKIIHEAFLTIEFDTEEIPEQRDKNAVWRDPIPPFIACNISRQS